MLYIYEKFQKIIENMSQKNNNFHFCEIIIILKQADVTYYPYKVLALNIKPILIN